MRDRLDTDQGKRIELNRNPLHPGRCQAGSTDSKGRSVQFSLSSVVALPDAGAPALSVTAKPAAEAALLGADYPGLRPTFAVAVGDRVDVGQVLFRDRSQPRIAFVAPMSGRVASVDFGPRRCLSALVIHRDGDAPDTAGVGDPVDVSNAEGLREVLLSKGLWPAFRTRPFGRIPDPDAMPRAIFVTATDTEPLAPDPRVVLASQDGAFRRGVALLTLLTEGTVHVCQSPGPPLAEATGRVRVTSFAGAHPSGLAGNHIHTLHPVGPGAEVWTIDCQDVAAIGHLAETGAHAPSRIVAVAGPRAPHSMLVRTTLGASIRDLAAGEHAGAMPARVLSGSVLSGRDAAWLGRYHRQVTIIDAVAPPRRRGWRTILGTRQVQGPRPIIPTRALEHALPAGFLAVPLIRALAVGDADAAARLGALELIEEDMALLSAHCTSGADYGMFLRRVLDALAESA